MCVCVWARVSVRERKEGTELSSNKKRFALIQRINYYFSLCRRSFCESRGREQKRFLLAKAKKAAKGRNSSFNLAFLWNEVYLSCFSYVPLYYSVSQIWTNFPWFNLPWFYFWAKFYSATDASKMMLASKVVKSY